MAKSKRVFTISSHFQKNHQITVRQLSFRFKPKYVLVYVNFFQLFEDGIEIKNLSEIYQP